MWHRGVMGMSMLTCVLYGLGPESANHLFSSCNQISQVWYSIFLWFGVELMPSHGVLEFFLVFLGMGMSRKDRLGWLLI
jgi:hypothetical protein